MYHLGDWFGTQIDGMGAVCDHDEDLVAHAIAKAIDAGRTELIQLPEPKRNFNEVPPSLREYEVEQASAVDYDWLMTGGERHA